MKELGITITPIEKDAEGFLPTWRKLLAAKRALTDFEKGQPEDVDSAIELLIQHITEPKERIKKLEILEKITSEQLLELLDALMGKNLVSPQNGGE